MTRATYSCPCGCQQQISSNRLACPAGWRRLSKPVRDAVWATLGLPTLHPDRVPDRLAAIEEWKK